MFFSEEFTLPVAFDPFGLVSLFIVAFVCGGYLHSCFSRLKCWNPIFLAAVVVAGKVGALLIHAWYLVGLGGGVDAISYYYVAAGLVDEGRTMFDLVELYDEFSVIWGSSRTGFFQVFVFATLSLVGGNYLAGGAILMMVYMFSAVYVLKPILGQDGGINVVTNGRTRTVIVVSLCLFPSQLFWTSSYVKETLICPLVLVLVGAYLRIVLKGGGWGLVEMAVIVCVAFVIFLIRPAFLLLVVFVMCLIIWKITFRYHPAVRWGGRCMLVVVVMVFLGSFGMEFVGALFQESRDMYNVYDEKGTASVGYGDGFRSGMASGVGLVVYVPLMFLTVVFRPWIWEASNLVSFCAAVENLGVVLLIWKCRSGLKACFTDRGFSSAGGGRLQYRQSDLL